MKQDPFSRRSSSPAVTSSSQPCDRRLDRFDRPVEAAVLGRSGGRLRRGAGSSEAWSPHTTIGPGPSLAGPAAAPRPPRPPSGVIQPPACGAAVSRKPDSGAEPSPWAPQFGADPSGVSSPAPAAASADIGHRSSVQAQLDIRPPWLGSIRSRRRINRRRAARYPRARPPAHPHDDDCAPRSRRRARSRKPCEDPRHGPNRSRSR